MRRKFWLDEQALSTLAGMLARRPETKKRRHGAALRKWPTRSCQEEKASLVAAAVTIARTRIKLAHELRDEALRVPKEHEDELLRSLSRQHSPNEYMWMLM